MIEDEVTWTNLQKILDRLSERLSNLELRLAFAERDRLDLWTSIDLGLERLKALEGKNKND